MDLFSHLGEGECSGIFNFREFEKHVVKLGFLPS